MKNIMRIITGLTLIIFMISSCKKEYTCTCTFTSVINNGPEPYTISDTEKLNGNDASEWCSNMGASGTSVITSAACSLTN